MFAGNAGAYPSEAPFRCSPLGLAPGLTHKHKTWAERLARDKYSSLIRKVVTYGRKKFYNFGTWPPWPPAAPASSVAPPPARPSAPQT
jgi:hypothetical protein